MKADDDSDEAVAYVEDLMKFAIDSMARKISRQNITRK